MLFPIGKLNEVEHGDICRRILSKSSNYTLTPQGSTRRQAYTVR